METIRTWDFEEGVNRIGDAKCGTRFQVADLPSRYGQLIARCPEMKAAVSDASSCMVKILSNCIIGMVKPEDAKRKLPVLDSMGLRIGAILASTAAPEESDWVFHPTERQIISASTEKLIGTLIGAKRQADGYLIASAPQLRMLLVDLIDLSRVMHTHLEAFSKGNVKKHSSLYQDVKRLGNPLAASQDVLAWASGIAPVRTPLEPPADAASSEAPR